MIRITDKAFRYTPSHETDLRKKFRKLRLEQQAAEARKAAEASSSGSVVAMVARRSAPNA